MNKEKFLELASQLFDQSTKLKEEEKIQIEVNLFEEIVDQITSEVFDNGIDLVDDYDLGMCGREVELESVEFNLRKVEAIVKEVLERYFSTFG